LGLKRDELTREWRILHNKKLHDLYFSPTIIRVIKLKTVRWAGHVARMGDRTGTYRVLVGKPEKNRLLGRPRHRWKDNIKMDLQEVGLIWLRTGTGDGHL
jgi:S-ribosylhomocysteine lyase LuxS involved in autoinducer biosynthesis